jgi:hypothetical protein
MSDFVVSSEQITNINFEQASVYVDACFVLAYLNPDDNRSDKAADALDTIPRNRARLIKFD